MHMLEALQAASDTLVRIVVNDPSITKPQVNIGSYVDSFNGGVEVGFGTLSWYVGEDKDLAIRVIRATRGKWTKTASNSFMTYKHIVSDGVRLEVVISRSAVCERVVTGTEEIVHPAVDERVEVVETVEWICHPLLKKEVVK